MSPSAAQIARPGPASRPEHLPDEPARLAYWINAYTAAVLVSVVRLWPIESVLDEGPP
jgi:hypothetical protein